MLNRYKSSFFIILLIFVSCTSTKDFTKSELYSNLGPYLHYYEGLQNRLYGNPEEAISSLQQSIKLDTTNSAAYYELALCYSALNKTDSAIINIRKAEQIEPYNAHYKHLLVLSLISNQDIKEAYIYQKDLVALDSTNENYKYQLALLASDLGNYEESLNIFSELENLYGYIPRLSETKAKIFLEKKNNEAAEKEIRKLIEHESENPVYYLYLSELYFRQGNDSLGFEVINTAKSIDPNSPHVLIEMYQRRMQIGDYDKALEALQQIYSNDEFRLNEKLNFFRPILFEQQIYSRNGDKLDKIVNGLLDEYPESLQLFDIAYEHFIRRTNYAKARECLEEAFRLDKNNPQRLERIITFDYSFDRKESVVYNSLVGMRRFPKYYIFYVFNALCLDEMGDTESAIITIKKGIKNVEDSENISELYGTLGDFYYENSQNFYAFQSYRRGLKHNPENVRILNNYSYYLSLNERRLSKALKLSSKAVDLEPNNSTFLDTKGWVLFKMGNYRKAKEVLRLAIAKGGDSSAVINEHYGDALYKTGSTDSAYMYWLKASEIEEPSESLKEKLRDKVYVP